MLRTNLSTRPFYNERLVQLVLWAAAAVVAALTVFNAVELRLLSTRQQQLLGRVGDDEKRAVRLRTDAEQARRSVDRAQLETVAASAREANELIDQRTFSWTELLNRLEATLPPEVRIQSIRPIVDRSGTLTVVLVVIGHRAEEIEQFVEQLEATGAFQQVNLGTETTNQQGLLEVVLEGRYLPTAATKVATSPAAAAGQAGPSQAAVPAANTRPARED